MCVCKREREIKKLGHATVEDGKSNSEDL
jgi:hypothetical protein